MGFVKIGTISHLNSSNLKQSKPRVQVSKVLSKDNVEKALVRARLTCDQLAAPAEKVKALGLVLEEQIKHSDSKAKDTFDAIEKTLDDCSYNIDLDNETWTRIALADAKLN